MASFVAMGGARAIALAAAALLFAPVAARADSWYPGDLHVHTCYSHDAYCGPTDDNTGPDVFYSSGGTVRSTPAFGRPGPWTVKHARIGT
ncbi:MAG: hypothetical protein QOI98_2686 [Solirubrobacteraceae bacterium]|nr:hypothetical protein [Solirubrobacteraceae bacterium]